MRKQVLLIMKVIVVIATIFIENLAQVIPPPPKITPSTSMIPSISSLPSTTSSMKPSATPSISIPPHGSALPSKTVSSTPSPSEDVIYPEISPQLKEIACTRNTSRTAPTLGTSQLKYALAVVGSAAAVAFASIIYTLSTGWDRLRQGYDALRITGIIVARLLIAFSIKISAALVATISSSDPEDGALDASGAFLTWGSAILTRTYYEAFSMTLRANGFIFSEDPFWDKELRLYLSPETKYHPAELQNNGNDDETGLGQTEGSHRSSRLTQQHDKKYYLSELFFQGRKDRQVLIFHALLYTLFETATLIINLKGFVLRFSEDAENETYVPFEQAGQCGIMQKDAPLLIGSIATQIIFLVTQQQSLVPLLTISASSNRTKEVINRYVSLNFILYGVFVAWLISLLCLPLFGSGLNSIFIVGDLSLFWYVMVGVPGYRDPAYIIAVTYTLITTCIGVALITKILRSPFLQELHQSGELNEI